MSATTYPFLFKGRLVPGYVIPNDRRLTDAIRKEYSDDGLFPVLLTIKLTHFKEQEEPRWMSCLEVDTVNDEREVYNDILGEYVMPCFLSSESVPITFLYNLMETPVDLSRDIEFYFKSTTADLEVKVLRNGSELRQNKGAGRRLHSLSPIAVRLDSFLYL
jgi:hypothetical protein